MEAKTITRKAKERLQFALEWHKATAPSTQCASYRRTQRSVKETMKSKYWIIGAFEDKQVLLDLGIKILEERICGDLYDGTMRWTCLVTNKQQALLDPMFYRFVWGPG